MAKLGVHLSVLLAVALVVFGDVAAARVYAPLAASGAAVVLCESSMRGEGIPQSEQPTKSVSAFGIFEFTPEHRDLRRFRGALLRDKAPIAVRGDVPVTVSVPERMRHRIALAYAGRGRYAEVRFEPCIHKPRTVWAGGLILRDRQPVKLLVATGEQARRALWLGRLPTPTSPRG